MKYNKLSHLTIIAVTSLLFLNGCVERLITVTSQPSGAIVWLNDQEVGATPVTVPFTFYGTYDVTLRKDNYQAVNTSKNTPVPIYQWLGIDLITECFLPFNFSDKHNWHFEMDSVEDIDPDKLIERAKTLRLDMSKTTDAPE